MSPVGQAVRNHEGGGRRCGHPIKAARTAALCWVFSIVQRKDRPSRGTALLGCSTGGAGRAAGEAGTKCCPQERG